MITASELRIGNYLRISGQVTKATWATIYDLNPSPVSKDQFVPIPINGQWLINLGFTKQRISYSINISANGSRHEFMQIAVSKYLGSVYLQSGDKNNSREEDDIITIYNSNIKGTLYVHKLQNIYHALTGNELTLK